MVQNDIHEPEPALISHIFAANRSKRASASPKLETKSICVGTRKMSRPAIMIFTDQNGVEHECVVESFSNTYQVFILIHETKALTQTVILVP